MVVVEGDAGPTTEPENLEAMEEEAQNLRCTGLHVSCALGQLHGGWCEVVAAMGLTIRSQQCCA